MNVGITFDELQVVFRKMGKKQTFRTRVVLTIALVAQKFKNELMNNEKANV
jgi:hypothetical protein